MRRFGITHPARRSPLPKLPSCSEVQEMDCSARLFYLMNRPGPRGSGMVCPSFQALRAFVVQNRGLARRAREAPFGLHGRRGRLPAADAADARGPGPRARKRVSVPGCFAALRGGPRRASGSGSWPPPRSGSRRRRGYSKKAFFCSAGLLVLGPRPLFAGANLLLPHHGPGGGPAPLPQGLKSSPRLVVYDEKSVTTITPALTPGKHGPA